MGGASGACREPSFAPYFSFFFLIFRAWGVQIKQSGPRRARASWNDTAPGREVPQPPHCPKTPAQYVARRASASGIPGNALSDLQYTQVAKYSGKYLLRWFPWFSLVFFGFPGFSLVFFGFPKFSKIFPK